MKFTIHPEVFATFPDFKVGYVIARNIGKPEHPDQIRDLLDEAIAEAKAYSLGDERVQIWRDRFEQIHLDPNDHKPAHVALLERVKKNNSIPHIEPIVDIANAISLKHCVPIGTHQLDELSQDVVIRATVEGDTFTAMNQFTAEQVDPGIFAYTSGNRVLTKNLVWRQGETSKIRETTQHVLIPVDAFDHISDKQLLEILHQIKDIVKSTLGGELSIGILSSSHPSSEWTLLDQDTQDQVSHIDELLKRGVAEVLPSADTLKTLMKTRKIRVFLGIDPTGSLLTLGHSVVLRKLQQFAELGHDVILLIGNGTVRIGDPTGRDSTRPVLTDEQIEENFKTWQSQASKILDFAKIRIVHNGDWLDRLTYTDLIKLMAQTTVQQLIERDMFQERIKNGLPIFGHEIMYPLMQGYDSVAMNVDLEIGGTDQTFNMMMGRHLQKAYNNHEKWVLTTPIINGTDGRKMSKSYGNFVALTDSPQDMYGKLMSISDEMILEYFTVLTDESVQSIQAMKTEMKAGTNPMVFKKKLAFIITEMYHTKADALQAGVYFEKTVQKKEAPDEIPIVVLKDQMLSLLEIIKHCLPKESNSVIRRLIEQGSIEISFQNLEKDKPINPLQLLGTVNIQTIKIGKRRYFKIETK